MGRQTIVRPVDERNVPALKPANWSSDGSNPSANSKPRTSGAAATATSTPRATPGLPIDAGGCTHTVTDNGLLQNGTGVAVGRGVFVGVSVGQMPPGHGVFVGVGVDVGPDDTVTSPPKATAEMLAPLGSPSDALSSNSVAPTPAGTNRTVARVPPPSGPNGGGAPNVPQPKCSARVVPNMVWMNGGGHDTARPVLPRNPASVASRNVRTALS